MSISIKKAKFEDAAIIAFLGRKTFQETFEHVINSKAELEKYLTNTFSVERIESSLGKANNVFWVVRNGDVPIGYAKFKIHSTYDERSNNSQLQKIYILKDFIDKNIGVELYQHIENEAKANDRSSLWLVVLDSNLRAVRFYEKLGFYKIKKHFFSIGTQQFEFQLMEKQLN